MELDGTLREFAITWLEHLKVLPTLLSLLSLLILHSFIRKHYLLDATQIFRALPKQKRIAFIKLGFFMVSFFLYLYR